MRQEIKRASEIIDWYSANYLNLEWFSLGLPINKIAKRRYQRGCVERPKKACKGSNKQETLVGVSGLWLLLIKRCSAKLSFQSNQTKVNDFVTKVANKKWRLHSSQQLSWSSKTGWQVFKPWSLNDSWIFDWRCGWTIASLRRITCLKEGQTEYRSA